jgi:hypothetical protein
VIGAVPKSSGSKWWIRAGVVVGPRMRSSRSPGELANAAADLGDGAAM